MTTPRPTNNRTVSHVSSVRTNAPAGLPATTGSPTTAVSRFLKNPFVKVAGANPAGRVVTTVIAGGLLLGGLLNKNGNTPAVGASKQKMPTRGDVLAARRRKQRPAAGCRFNLPPHAWSLPLRPIQVDANQAMYVNVNNKSNDIHRERRGVIWWYSTGSEVSVTDDSGTVTTAEAKKKEGMTPEQQKQAEKNAKSSDGESIDFNYGFQFLWNPEAIQQSIARNMDVTPSSADRLRSVSGAFPGQESVQFSIVLDRVHDFAAIKSTAGDKKAEKSAFPAFTQALKNQYKYGMSDSAALTNTSMNQQLYELSRYGTMADLEYLFKAINGAGPGTGWVTLLGKKTANIGFLSPTLLAFRFGPDSQESLSFVGWITNLSLNHTMFSEEMIPLRTTVTFSVDCFAGSSIV